MYQFNMVNSLLFRASIRIKSAVILLVFLFLMLPAITAHGETEYVEIVHPLKITLDSNTLEGFIMYKLCRWDKAKNKSRCKVERLLVTPETKAYARHQRVSLLDARSRLGKSVSLGYDKDSLVVKSISW